MKVQADFGNIINGRKGIKDIIHQWELLIQDQKWGHNENHAAMSKMLKKQLALIMSLTELSCDHLSSLGLPANTPPGPPPQNSRLWPVGGLGLGLSLFFPPLFSPIFTLFCNLVLTQESVYGRIS